jgi:sugar lactone lactonase YvrE
MLLDTGADQLYFKTYAGVESLFVNGLGALSGLASDSSGNVYCLDVEGRVVKIGAGAAFTELVKGFKNQQGNYLPHTNCSGLAVDGNGNVYVASTPLGEVFKVAPNGSSTVLASVSAPQDLAIDASGNLYTGNVTNKEINKITSGGAVSVYVSGLPIGPDRLAFDDSTGALYVASSSDTSILKIDSSQSVSTFASFSAPQGLACDSAGNLYVSDATNASVAMFTPAGVESTFATGMTSPSRLCVAPSGAVLVARDDTASNPPFAGITSISLQGIASALYLDPIVGPIQAAYDGIGTFYVTTTQNEIKKVTTGGAVGTFLTGLDTPVGIARDLWGNLYVAENGRIDRVSPQGAISVFAVVSGQCEGLAFDGAGFLYTCANGQVYQITPQGGVATYGQPIDGAYAMVTDLAGNVFVTSSTAHKVYEITPDQTVSAFSDRFNTPSLGLALDPATGRFYVGNDTIFNEIHLSPDSGTVVNALKGAGFRNLQGVLAW